MLFRGTCRGIRSAGGGPCSFVGLLAVSIAANGAVFAVADSRLLNPQPYQDADRNVVAIAGVCGLMAFLVAGRMREIGIRMGLVSTGATSGAQCSLPQRSSCWPGAVLGSAAALLTSRWIESQLFDVSPADPTSYLRVGAVVRRRARRHMASGPAGLSSGSRG